MDGQKQLGSGKKILYGLIIALCSLTILLSSVMIIGVWVVRQPLSDSALAILELVQNTTLTARRVEQRLDSILANLETLSGDIGNASEQLSQNISDKGLLQMLLPEEKEQELADSAREIQTMIGEVRETITTALELYRSIDRLPFVSLPGLSAGQIDQISTTVEKIQNLAETLRTEIVNLRMGLSERVDQVSLVVSQLTSELTQVRAVLAELDARLVALEVLVVRLQKIIPPALLAIALILTLLFGFVIYTQVEVIRLYVRRWRNPRLGGAVQASMVTETKPSLEATEPLPPSKTDEAEEVEEDQ